MCWGLSDLKEVFYKVHHAGVSRADIAALALRVVALAEVGDMLPRKFQPTKLMVLWK